MASISLLLSFSLSMCGSPEAAGSGAASPPRPNVVLVMTDDQGYGDIHAQGNSMIRTPNLDKLYSQSVRLTDFHVDPTCSPTRSALMSGRYSTRTGVWHTIMGRSLMSSAEVTMAEVFHAGGYRTAMFGKWHLGDNYPCRPFDQGFDETFYNGGGGVTQTPDYFGNKYFDDTYFRNGVPEKVTGYCTDVWFDNALEFIERNTRQKHPFFVYISTNAAHGPYLVAKKYSSPYEKQGVPPTMAAFYGMITNIDENMGKLMSRLDALGIAKDTILVFLTDNGTAAGIAGNSKRARKGAQGKWRGFNAGMRGRKGSPYDGGHRVPFYIRWPAGRIQGGRDVVQLSAHVDVLPTLADLCGLKRPEGPPLDGKSLVPLLRGLRMAWPARTLFVHSQRIEHPRKWRQASVMTQQYRLINGEELYDIRKDPGQAHDISKERPEVVARLRREYDAWWDSLTPVFDKYVRIHLGSPKENPSRLTCHDWHTEGGPVPWNQGSIRRGTVANGFWAIEVERAGRYAITLRRWPASVNKSIEAVRARLATGRVDVHHEVSPTDTATTFEVNLPAGPARLQTWLTMPNGKTRGAYFVQVKFLE